MSEENKIPEAAAFERVICQIKDVLGARLVTNQDGNISEIHIMATGERNPKQIVRDVESALLVQMGVAVDRKKISVVQMDEGGLPAATAEKKVPYRATGAPLRLVSINFFTRGLEAEATVEVEAVCGGNIYQGYACGPNVPARHLRLVAEATVNAIEKSGYGLWRLALEDLVVVEVARRRAVVSLIVLLDQTSCEYLVGAALVRGDERRAAAETILQAFKCSKRH
ncbi:MAG: hypothetical protein AB2448_03620 [Moorella sp. (in: firmicutes)]